MGYIASFLTSFCAAAVFIGALYMLCPEGVMSKSVKYILSLCFLVSVISAAGITVKRVDLELSFSAPAVSSAELQIKNAEFVYSYALDSAGIEFSSIEIFTDKLEDNSIVINKVRIKSGSEKQKIISALGEAAKNIEVEVINE